MTMSWNHRVCKLVDGSGSMYYIIREVYYEDDGSVYAQGQDIIVGETLEELQEQLEWMLDCLSKPAIKGEV